jgi:hypothetical protein
VDVRNVRYQVVVSRPNPVPPEGPGPYQNIGVDETGEEPDSYTVVVKIPRGGPGTLRSAKADFAASLSAAAQQARAAVKDRRITSVFFRLPVEDRAHGGANHDQLHIDWHERPRRRRSLDAAWQQLDAGRQRLRGAAASENAVDELRAGAASQAGEILLQVSGGLVASIGLFDE